MQMLCSQPRHGPHALSKLAGRFWVDRTLQFVPRRQNELVADGRET